MMFRTHLVFGFLAGLIAKSWVAIGNVYIFFGFVLLGAILPDIDEAHSKISKWLPFLSKAVGFLTKHRGIVHSLFFAVLVGGLVWYFISQAYGWALFIGCSSHLLIDGTTKAGINYIHPLKQLRTAGFIETGSWGEHLVFLVIIILIVVKLI